MNEDVPSNIQGSGPWVDVLNRIFSCLRRRAIIQGDGIELSPSKDGVTVSAAASSGAVIWIKCCLEEDDTVCYVPVRVAGMPRRSKPEDDTTFEAVTIEEEDIPEGSFVLE